MQESESASESAETPVLTNGAAGPSEPRRKRGSGEHRGNHNAQTHGFLTAKRRALKANKRKVDGRTSEGRQLIRDRARFRRRCGSVAFDLEREKRWEAVERMQRVLNRVDPTILALPSLVNKRTRNVMAIAIDYKNLVMAHGDTLDKAFEGLEAPGHDPVKQAYAGNVDQGEAPAAPATVTRQSLQPRAPAGQFVTTSRCENANTRERDEDEA